MTLYKSTLCSTRGNWVLRVHKRAIWAPTKFSDKYWQSPPIVCTVCQKTMKKHLVDQNRMHPRRHFKFLWGLLTCQTETQILERASSLRSKISPSKFLFSQSRAAKLIFDWLHQLSPFSSNFSLCLGHFFLQVYFIQNILGELLNTNQIALIINNDMRKMTNNKCHFCLVQKR